MKKITHEKWSHVPNKWKWTSESKSVVWEKHIKKTHENNHMRIFCGTINAWKISHAG